MEYVKIKYEGEVISVAVYSEKIADNDRKIEQLSKNINATLIRSSARKYAIHIISASEPLSRSC